MDQFGWDILEDSADEEDTCVQVANVPAAESCRVTSDGNYLAGPMSLTYPFPDESIAISKINAETGEVSDFCTVPMPACLGTGTFDGIVYAACTNGATSCLAMCSEEGEYLGAIDLPTVQLANDLTYSDGMIFL